FGAFVPFGTVAAFGAVAALRAFAAFGALGTVGGAIGANFVTLAGAAFHRGAGLAAITTVSTVAALTAAHTAGGAASLLDETLVLALLAQSGGEAGGNARGLGAIGAGGGHFAFGWFALGIAFCVGFVVTFGRLGLRGAGCFGGPEQFIDVAGFGFVDLGELDAVTGFVLKFGRRLDGGASGGHGGGEFGARLRFGLDGEFGGGGGVRFDVHGIDRRSDRSLRDLFVDWFVNPLVSVDALGCGRLVFRLIGFLGLVDFFDDGLGDELGLGRVLAGGAAILGQTFAGENQKVAIVAGMALGFTGRRDGFVGFGSGGFGSGRGVRFGAAAAFGAGRVELRIWQTAAASAATAIAALLSASLST